MSTTVSVPFPLNLAPESASHRLLEADDNVIINRHDSCHYCAMVRKMLLFSERERVAWSLPKLGRPCRCFFLAESSKREAGQAPVRAWVFPTSLDRTIAAFFSRPTASFWFQAEQVTQEAPGRETAVHGAESLVLAQSLAAARELTVFSENIDPS